MLPSFSVAATQYTSSTSKLSQESPLQDAINQARDTAGRGDFSVAVRGLQARLGHDQYAFHSAILTLLNSSSSQNRQELIKETFIQHPHFDLNAHGKEGKTALDLAVQDNDQEFARYLLGKGAKPEKVSIVSASDGMKTLITAWRRTKQLYAHFNDKSNFDLNLTPLDHALQTGDFEEVRAALEDKMQQEGKSTNDLWHAAMQEGNKSILRALLIVGKPDELRELITLKMNVGEWKEKLRDDPGLSAVLKEFPYQSAKRGWPESFNGEAYFANSSTKKITCQHLATYQLKEQALKPRRKFDYSKFKNPEVIREHVKPDIEETFQVFRTQAPEKHLIDNAEFGQFLARQFEAMENKDKRPRKMLIQSTQHVMSLTLMIKEKQGKKSFVAQFYDPNETTSSTRSKADSPQTFEMQTIEEYLEGGATTLREYYPEAKKRPERPIQGKSMIFVYPEGEAGEGSVSSSVSSANSTLTSPLKLTDVDDVVIWHLMCLGLAGNLRQLRDHFNTFSERTRIELLFGKYGLTRCTALDVGMLEGHVEAIKAYDDLLASISLEPRMKLLAEKNDIGMPAIYIAMLYRHPGAIKAYGEMLASTYAEFCESRLVKRQKIDLDELPSLTFEEQFIELFAAKNAKGIPALYTIMKRGDAGDVELLEAYGELLKPLPPDKQAELLLAKMYTDPCKGQSGLEIAIKKGKFEMATRCIAMLNELAQDLSANKRTELWSELKGCEEYMANAMQNPSSFQRASKLQQSFVELKTALGR